MANYSLDDLLYLMSRLRDPQDGCPWDLAQNFSSIISHTIEESYELADAIASGDTEHMCEELGDVLWYLAVLSQDLGQSLDRTAEMNLEKLSERKKRGTLAGSGDNR